MYIVKFSFSKQWVSVKLHSVALSAMIRSKFLFSICKMNDILICFKCTRLGSIFIKFIFTCRASNTFLKIKYRHIRNLSSSVITYGPLDVCGDDCVCRAAAFCLCFDVLVYSGRFWAEVGTFSSAQVRLQMDKI